MICSFSSNMLLHSQIKIIGTSGVVGAITTLQYEHPAFHGDENMKISGIKNRTLASSTLLNFARRSPLGHRGAHNSIENIAIDADPKASD